MHARFHPIVLTGTLFAVSALMPACAGGHEQTAGAQVEDEQQEHEQHEHEHEHGQHEHESYWFGQVGDPGKVTRTIKVTTVDIKYEPAVLTVKAGDTIKFEVTNQGKLPHEFVLADEASQLEHDKEMQEMAKSMPGMTMEHNDPNMITIQPGETKTLVWHFTTPGKLQFGCHVPGHYAAGMVGQLTIT